MNKQKNQQKVVPVTLEKGMTALINPNDIPQDKWAHHHGKTAAGQQVNSLQSIAIGDSLIIRNSGSGPALSVSKCDFEVAAVQILADMGYEMKAPA